MPVSLAANALIDEDEFASYIGSGTTIDVDGARRAINRASDILCEWLGRPSLIAPASPLVEFHTVPPGTSRIHLLDWPVASVATVHEDAAREYGAATLLDTDQYMLSKPSGTLIRVEPGGGEAAWLTGLRAVRVSLTPGYAIAAVPARFKDAAGNLAAMLWAEKKRAQFGATGMSDGQGNFTRLSASHLPKYITEPLQGDRAPRVDRTGERDA